MCGVHLLRELTGIYENQPEQTWAKEIYDILLGMCHAAEFYHQHPEIGSRHHYMDCLKKNYDTILEKAVLMNPIPKKKKISVEDRRKGKSVLSLTACRNTRTKSAVLLIIHSFHLQTIRQNGIFVW